MISLSRYFTCSFLAFFGAVIHAFISREQLYPATVYLYNSRIFFFISRNMIFALVCLIWQLVKHLFFGSLRDSEIEALKEQVQTEFMEVLYIVLSFYAEILESGFWMLTTFLFIKTLHLLVKERVNHIGTISSVPMSSHVRIVSLTNLLVILDFMFIYSFIVSVAQTWPEPTPLIFLFQYLFLAISVVSAYATYASYVFSMFFGGQSKGKSIYAFVLDIACDLIHFYMNVTFLYIAFVSHRLSLSVLYQLRISYIKVLNRVAACIRYWKITTNMNKYLKEATPQDFYENDTTCIICRDEMFLFGAKKLPCGHIFHVDCLLSWMQENDSCPTCRSSVVRHEKNSIIVQQRRNPSQSYRTGPAETATSRHESDESENGAMERVTSNQHQARLQAAVRAASIYGKSCVSIHIQSSSHGI
ncbi:Anaphase-promoting complex (APC) subunit 11 protein [Dioscorea alata]|uniref:Anaphase-promoting complex (APC) subunit 11 protein n=1 Tax=Dioscorea alata TaxID=55571 RepID=A0ACB7VC14_DIOAL|nr:Anaphase-promoting complex (APC) subunit 11 protein [Dioscorea alata]